MNLSLLELTLRVAVVATLLNIPLAIAASWFVVKGKSPSKFILDILISLPLAVPPVSVGFVLLIVLGREGPIGVIAHRLFGVDLVFTWIANVVATSIMSFPLISRAIIVAIAGVDERLEMSARSLGAGPWRVFFTITIPLAYPGILAGVLLGFVRALSEFGASILVAGNIEGKTQTLSMAIYSRVQLRDDAVAVQLVGISIVLAVVTLAVHNWLLKRAEKKS